MKTKLLHRVFTPACFLLATLCTFGQVGINTTTPEGILDVSSNTHGIVLPRVALTATNVAAPVVNPQGGALAVGTVVYNTNETSTGSNDVYKGIYVWNGSEWYNKFAKKHIYMVTQTSMMRPVSSNGYVNVPGLSSQNFTAKYTGTYKIDISMNYGGGYVSDNGPTIDILTQDGNFRFTFDGTNYITPVSTYCTILGTRFYAIWEQFSRTIYIDLVAGQTYNFRLQFDALPAPYFVNSGNSGNGRGYIGIPDHAPCSVEFTYLGS